MFHVKERKMCSRAFDLIPLKRETQTKFPKGQFSRVFYFRKWL